MQLHIEIKDGSSWETLHEPGGAWPAQTGDAPSTGAFYEFQNGPTDQIELRFTLFTPSHGFSRFSPTARGELAIRAYDDTASSPAWADPHTEVRLNMTETSKFATLNGVELTGDPAAMMRLEPVTNPWVLKLGNPSSDWGRLLTDPDTGGPITTDELGARVGAMDLSPDGQTLYVGTEGIYKIGAPFTEAPLGFDNTLYGIDVATGDIVNHWNYSQFRHTDANGDPDPITFVRACDTGAYVITENATAGGDEATPVIWKVNETGVYDWSTDRNAAWFSQGDRVTDLEVGRLDAADPLDPIVAVTTDLEGSSLDGGVVAAFDGADLSALWESNPSAKGYFEFIYPVPKNATLGAYIVESRFTWEVSDALGTEVTQTGRLHNTFTVTPPNQQVALSPTYTLEAVVWMEDWG